MQVGRRQGRLLRQHLRRRVPLLARVPRQHGQVPILPKVTNICNYKYLKI
jgi:hypothetical protein